MVYLHQHQKRKWIESDRAVTVAFVLAAWVVAGVFHCDVISLKEGFL